MLDDDMFAVFADWARKKGIEDASKRIGAVLTSDQLKVFRDEYQRLVDSIIVNDPPIVTMPYQGWYPGPGESDTYWPALREYFASALSWSPSLIQPVDQSSSKVVAYTPDPSKGSWTCKGLVVGYVQSGKTTNFTSVIAKAADVGYKLVIVLSGIHNGLRRQTQLRLDQQLRDLHPTAWLTLTDENNDFKSQPVNSSAMLHGQTDKVALCVAKKNHAVLNRLDRWLKDASKAGVLADLPTLIIDDEADQASVETKTINPLIRRIIDKLPKCTYIGYTATPFANVLIDPGGGDLYPANFILNLPRPDRYFGTERIFGRDEVEGDEASGVELDGYDMIRLIDDDDLDSLRPSGKTAAEDFSPELVPSLETALHWFWLATAARRARGDDSHSTMLVHTSMKTAVHDSFKVPLTDFRDSLLRRLRAQDSSVIAALRQLWESEASRVPAADFGIAPTSFDSVLAQLAQVVGDTKVVLDNSRSLDRLDYTNGTQTAIAVGGNTLSRGLTLEGLVVSFFVRSVGTYDTLLQMARWFGFRGGYEDLPRIWMTDQLRDWFRHLATVEHEIRADIERYEQQGLSPVEFGVRIRTHPVLRVTAKMGAARPAYASYGGRRIQTRYFKESDRHWLENNVQAADALITEIRADGGLAEELDRGGQLYRDVSADLVTRFLHAYRAHEDSPDLDAELIVRYVDKQRQQGSLGLWNVAVMSSADDSLGTVQLGGLSFNRIARSKLVGSGNERADIKTLMSKEHRVVDLKQISPSQARSMGENALMDARNADVETGKRGLVLIYPIDPNSRPDAANEQNRSKLAAATDVIGLAMVFPGNAEAKSQVQSTYIAVDLSDAERTLDAEELEILEGVGE